jgi:hemerythrin-like domain-containing protein
MELIAELRQEHDLIERVVGSLRTFVDLRRRGDGDPADGERFMRFFRLYAGHFHHAREEDTLFVALVREAELPRDRGPIAVLLDEHAQMAAILDGIAPLIALPALDEGDAVRLGELATAYSRALWRHIDAENSVLLPESEARLRKHGVTDLPTRPMTGDEQHSRSDGERLVERYPPLDDPDVIRGDGCVMCPAFTTACNGLEHEWWNEWEWEEFEDHLPSG